MIKDYLKNNILITDGAMGTYYSGISSGGFLPCEEANLTNPEIIERIHKEYISVGAVLIKTNTFSANKFCFESEEYTKEIVLSGIEIAKKAADKDTFIAADIGPFPDNLFTEEITEEEKSAEIIRICDIFINKGLEIFLFETFGDFNLIRTASEHIKRKNKDAFVIASFSVNTDGYSRKGISAKKLIEAAASCEFIDACGLNCGAGPASVLNIAKQCEYNGKIPIIMPNAGMPDISGQRAFYSGSPDYFVSVLKEALECGFKILGGCCGTNPEYIKKLNDMVFNKSEILKKSLKPAKAENIKTDIKKIKPLIIVVEIEAPFSRDAEKCINSAREVIKAGADYITISDSPMGKPRADSVSLAAKIKRELGVETIPHICCRDKNINALKSSLIAASIEGIDNILAVTGDAIAESDKGYVKSVFNLNSIGLIELISTLNGEIFKERPFKISAALNTNAANPKAELERMLKKAQKGVSMFLTQPVFNERAVKNLEYYYSNKPVNTKILCGIMPLVSYKNAVFIKNEVAGTGVPQSVVDLFNINMSKDEGEEAGINLALKTINEVIPFCDGLYIITPFYRGNLIGKLIESVKS